MPSLRRRIASFALAALSLTPWARADDPPAVGNPAPNFRLAGSDGKTYELAEFKGKSAVVVAWFPKAFTGG